MTTSEKLQALYYEHESKPYQNGERIFEALVLSHFENDPILYEIAENSLIESGIYDEQSINEDAIINELNSNEYYHDRSREEVYNELFEDLQHIDLSTLSKEDIKIYNTIF